MGLSTSKLIEDYINTAYDKVLSVASNLAAIIAVDSKITDGTIDTVATVIATNVMDDTIASYDSFDGRYLGAKASDPTLDNDGNALIVSALYWNTVSNEMKVWNGASWQAAAPVSGNADTLDGLDSLAFLRSDINDTLNNNLKYSNIEFLINAETDNTKRAVFSGGSNFTLGTLTADTIEDDNASLFEAVTQGSVSYTVASYYTASVYIKKDSISAATRWPVLILQFLGSTTEGNEIRLDTSTGVVVSSFTSTEGVSGVESVDDYWRLYLSARSVDVLNTSLEVQLFPAGGADLGMNVPATSAVGLITAWGAIVTEGDALLEYNAGVTANILTAPEDFSNVAWVKQNAPIIVTNAATAPDLSDGAYVSIEGNDYGGIGLGGDLDLIAGNDGNVTLVPGSARAVKIVGNAQINKNILDVNGNDIVNLQATVNAANYVELKNNIATAGPTISAVGTDTNIDLNLSAKGAGVVKYDSNRVLTTNDVPLSLIVLDEPVILIETLTPGGWFLADLSVLYPAAASAGAKVAYLNIMMELNGTNSIQGLCYLRKAGSGLSAVEKLRYSGQEAQSDAGFSPQVMDYNSTIIPLDANSDFEYLFTNIASGKLLISLLGYYVPS